MPNPFLADVDPVLYLKCPALSPDGGTVYFAHAGDIWSVPVEGGDAHQVTSSVGDDSSPSVSPDGSRLAFVSNRTGNGDLYLLHLTTGDLKRLTFFDGADAIGGWSPDGKWIAFTSRRDALSGGIHKVRATGGTPITLIVDPRESHAQATYSPDGKTLAFVNDGTQWWRRGPHPAGASAIWTVSEADGADDHRRITSWQGRNTCPMWAPDGKTLLYISDEGGADNIWRIDARVGSPEQLTDFGRSRCFRASIQPGGALVVIDGDDGLWSFDPDSGKVREIPVRVVGDQKTHPVANRVFRGRLDGLSVSPDGKKLAFAVHGEIFAAPASFEDTYDALRVTDSPFRESQMDWSADSRSIVYLSDREGDNQLFHYDFSERSESQLTHSAGQKYLPLCSPDGKWIAYVYNQNEIRLISTKTGKDRAFIKSAFFSGIGTQACYAWSPDSRWIVFLSFGEHFFTNLFVQRLGSKSPQQITFLSQLESQAPLWSPDGRFILFSTKQYRTQSQIARVDLKPVAATFREDEFEKLFEVKNKDDLEEGEEKGPDDGKDDKPGDAENGKETKRKDVEPVEITVDGIKRRLRLLTPQELDAHARAISPDGKHLIASASVAGRANLYQFSLEETKRDVPPKALTNSKSRKGAVSFMPDGKTIIYLDDGVIARRGFPDGKTKKLNTRCRLDVDFHIEKRQMFQEAWTLLRDHFYDPDYHGADWAEVRDRLLPLVAGARTKSDLVDILNRMAGELNSSHLGAGNGSAPSQDGHLGLSFNRNALEREGRFEIQSVLPDSPCDTVESPVQPGEVLEAIDGTPLGPQTNMWELLRHTPGRKTRLTLKAPRGRSREVAVRPLTERLAGDLSYRHWVRENTDYVGRISGKRLGYVHIRGMGLEDLQQFLIDLDTETHSRDGVVVDVRYNPGGHIATFILDVIAKRDTVVSSYRDHMVSSSAHVSGDRFLGKPTVLVTNEHSGSNAEMFSEGYRSQGLGKVVGTPTAGAVIWTTGWSLLDGTSFRVPFIRVATQDNENLELNARPVDVHVDRPLGEASRGIDSQLDKAVEVLLTQLDSA